MKPETAQRFIEIAKSFGGCHYLLGAYGATPGNEDGSPARRGQVHLIADPARLEPDVTRSEEALAVFAAWSHIPGKPYSVCGGSYDKVFGGSSTTPNAAVLGRYLDGLKTKSVKDWEPYYNNTPRRTYGPGETGQIYWGEDCRDVRHFDCIGYVNYCMWKLTGTAWQIEIKQWAANPNAAGGKVCDFADKDSWRPTSIEAGDIVCKVGGQEHIGIVGGDGAIYQAASTKVGVTYSSKFSLAAPGTFTHLVRLQI